MYSSTSEDKNLAKKIITLTEFHRWEVFAIWRNQVQLHFKAEMNQLNCMHETEVRFILGASTYPRELAQICVSKFNKLISGGYVSTYYLRTFPDQYCISKFSLVHLEFLQRGILTQLERKCVKVVCMQSNAMNNSFIFHINVLYAWMILHLSLSQFLCMLCMQMTSCYIRVSLGSGKLFPKGHLLFCSLFSGIEPIILLKVAHYSSTLL